MYGHYQSHSEVYKFEMSESGTIVWVSFLAPTVSVHLLLGVQRSPRAQKLRYP